MNKEKTFKAIKTILIIALCIFLFPFVLTISLAKSYGNDK